MPISFVTRISIIIANVPDFRSGRIGLPVRALCLAVLLAANARADCILDAYANPIPPFNTIKTLFPNWLRAPASSFILNFADDIYGAGWCTNGPLVGLTIMNTGTAVGGTDLTGMYFQVMCGTDTQSGTMTMTYAGIWDVAGTPYPAWTWAGSVAWGGDPCTAPPDGCACYANLFIYVDVGPCPADGASIQLMPGINWAADPVWPGGISDSCGCRAPWWNSLDGTPKEIRYLMKSADRDEVAPGDTVNYTIYYGATGTLLLTSIQVFDTLPDNTHYVMGSGTAPDPGWDPDPGPPQRLMWSVAGVNPIGGATRQITFSASVDWGNTESFEPGSGDSTPAEGSRLRNTAQAFWIGGNCPGPVSSQPTTTVVSRFLFWKTGNNDLLFASRVGLPNDEMIYEIFIKNKSSAKTWWNVAVWDTVPDYLNVWDPGYGMEDPCIGWTMTPSGCAGNSGKVLSGTKTILTWVLDLPPNATISLRWKSQLRSAVPAATTVINKMAIMELGKTGVVGGSGHSRVPAVFTHLATVVLRTTYYSYTSYAASINARDCTGFFISFFPLNVNTNFELRKLEYLGGGVAATGGKSATISQYVGNCVGGFADGGLSVAGCKAERAPAMYWPGIWDGAIGLSNCPPFPFNFLYKVTSNSPFLWMLLSSTVAVQMDCNTFDPSTSLTYRGFTHYMTLRPDEENLATVGHGDRLAILNTTMNSSDVFDPTLATTVHIFKWNKMILGWDYVKTGYIDPESWWMPFESTLGTDANDQQHFKVISSDAQNIIYHGCHTFGAPSLGGAFDNYGTIAPNSANGNLVASSAPANYYVIINPGSRTPNCVVGNVGTTQATYQVYQYVPYNTTVPNANWPTTLAGSSGYWTAKFPPQTVAPGLAVPGNPHLYGSGLDTFLNSTLTCAVAWKIELISGGPIQVYQGGCIYDVWSGASNIHAADGKASGKEFWFHDGPGGGGFGTTCTWDTYVINVFSPKTGAAVGMNSTGGWSATYTTDGPDQCIVWMGLTNLGGSSKQNYVITQRPGSADAMMVAQYQQCTYDEKFLTAPFVETGVHYDIIAPPVVYAGESFWLTVIVLESSGTRTDYCGISSFTSTDPLAKVENAPMDTYNYTWDSNDPAASCKAAGCIDGCDNGVRVFINVSFQDIGVQTLTAADITDGSIIGLATITVVGVDVKFTKEERLINAASGDTVNFRICWSNYSSSSALSFVITDSVPMGTTYVPQIATNHICGTTSPIVYDFAYATATSSTPPGAGSWTTTTGTPAGTVYWLRWTVKSVGINMTGCACFKVKVD